MSFLRRLFRKKQEEVWKALCEELHGDFVEGGLLSGDKIVVHESEWVITLDAYRSAGQWYTRIRAPYVNPKGFRFVIYDKELFRDEVGYQDPLEDIIVGHPLFDHLYVIKSNDPEIVKRLLSHDKIRELIKAQPKIWIQVNDDDGWFSDKFPEGVDELYCQVPGILSDPKRLRLFYELFAEILNYLCHLGDAYEDDPELQSQTQNLREERKDHISNEAGEDPPIPSQDS